MSAFAARSARAASAVFGAARTARTRTGRSGPRRSAPDPHPPRRDGHPPGVPLLAVLGGCGGAGASTLAAALALAALARGMRVALLDADPLGAGLDSLIRRSTDERPAGPPDGLAGAPPGAPRGPRRARVADLALIRWDDPQGRPVAVGGMRKALRIVRDSAHLVVADLPRTVDPAAQLVLAQASHSLLMLPVGDRSVLAASRVLPRVLDTGALPGLVVRLPKQDALAPRDVADLLGLDLVGVVRPHAQPDDLSGGNPIVRFADRYLARTVFGPGRADS